MVALVCKLELYLEKPEAHQSVLKEEGEIHSDFLAELNCTITGGDRLKSFGLSGLVTVNFINYPAKKWSPTFVRAILKCPCREVVFESI